MSVHSKRKARPDQPVPTEGISEDEIADIEEVLEEAGYTLVDPETRQPRKRRSKKVH